MSEAQELKRRTISFIKLGSGKDVKILKVGSCPMVVWEDFESLSESHNFKSIANSSIMEWARITIDLAMLNLTHHNPNIDTQWLERELFKLDEYQLIELFEKITDTDKFLLTNQSNKNLNRLTPEEKEDLKKKGIL